MRIILLVLLVIFMATAMAQEPQFAPSLTAEQAQTQMAAPAELQPVEPIVPSKVEIEKPKIELPIWETREGHDLAAKKVLMGEIARSLKVSQETGYLLKKYLPYLKACQKRRLVEIRRDTSFRWRTKPTRPTREEIMAVLRSFPQGHKKVYQEIKSWNPASVSFVEARDKREAAERKAAASRLGHQITEVQKHLGDWKLWTVFVGIIAFLGLILAIVAWLYRLRQLQPPSEPEEPIVVPEEAGGEIPVPEALLVTVPTGFQF